MLTRADKSAKDCRDAQGNTPLHLAAYYGQTHCLRQLIRCNADVNARNNAQQTPLICAASGGDVECVTLLAENDADLKAEDSDGFTAMIKAKSRKNVKIIRALQKAEGLVDDDLPGSDSEDEDAGPTPSKPRVLTDEEKVAQASRDRIKKSIYEAEAILKEFGIESAYTDECVGAEAVLSSAIRDINHLTASSSAASNHFAAAVNVATADSYSSRSVKKATEETTETYTNSARERRRAAEAAEAASKSEKQTYSSYKSSRFLDTSASTEFAANARSYKKDYVPVRAGKRSEIYNRLPAENEAQEEEAEETVQARAAARVKALEQQRQSEVHNIQDSAMASAEAAYYEAMRTVRNESTSASTASYKRQSSLNTGYSSTRYGASEMEATSMRNQYVADHSRTSRDAAASTSLSSRQMSASRFGAESLATSSSSSKYAAESSSSRFQSSSSTTQSFAAARENRLSTSTMRDSRRLSSRERM
jgi:hypothetical protein